MEPLPQLILTMPPVGRHYSPHFIDEETEFWGRFINLSVKEAQIQGEVQFFFDSRTQASSYKPRDSEDFCSHPTSKPGHLWRGRMQTWFLQSAQQLLNRTVDRGAALCPGEQRGTRPQLALGTGCQPSHRSGRNIEGRAGLEGSARPAGGTSPCKDLDEGLHTYLCVSDAFGNPMNLWAFS